MMRRTLQLLVHPHHLRQGGVSATAGVAAVIDSRRNVCAMASKYTNHRGMAKYGQVSEVDYYRDLIPRRREENTRTVTVCWSNGYEISVTATSRLRSNNLAHPPPDSYQVGGKPGCLSAPSSALKMDSHPRPPSPAFGEGPGLRLILT